MNGERSNGERSNGEWADRGQHRSVDLQIVGGGLAGLIAANLALDAGLSVRLIEKQRSPGGRAASADHQGFRLNHGPHALYLSGDLRAALRTLGIDPTGSAPALKGAAGSIGENVGLLPQGPGSLLRTSLLSARSKRTLATLMARLPRTKPNGLANLTVDQWIDDLADGPDLRALLWGLVNLSTYNAASRIASADAALLQLQLALDDGVIYLDGGWQSIVDALDARLAQHEAATTGRLERIMAQITEVATDDGSDGRVGTTATATSAAEDSNGSSAGQHLLPAANTIVAVGLPAVADRLLGGAGLVERAGPPVRAAVLDLGLRTSPQNHVYLGLDRGLYMTTQSVADRLAPAGQTLVSLARYIRPGDEHSAQQTRAELLAHAEAGGIDRSDIVMDRYLHRLTVAGGMPTAAGGGLAGRPAVSVPGHPGIHLAGDWVGERGLLADASAASATDAVAAVLAGGRRATVQPGPATTAAR